MATAEAMVSNEIRTFEAKTMQQALAEVRAAFGPDAVILQTRQLTRRGFVGDRVVGVEITAAAPQVEAPAPLEAPAAWPYPARPRPAVPLPPVAAEEPRAPEPAAEPEPERWLELARKLRDQEVPSEIIKDCVQAAARRFRADRAVSDLDLADFLGTLLVERIRTDEGSVARRRGKSVVAMVGPTGAGKTTTIAKLAAMAKIQNRRSVAFVNLDTYRVGAAEQLRGYAEILEAPLAVASTPERFREVLAEFAEYDVVLVDTTGRGPSDEGAVAQIARYFEPGMEIHLVLSAAMRDSSMRAAIDRFSVLDFTHVLLTKLDETPMRGGLLSVGQWTRAPISYWTTGQTVPDDIEPADAFRLAGLALGSQSLDTLAVM